MSNKDSNRMNLRIEAPTGLSWGTKIYLDDFEIKGISDLFFHITMEGRIAIKFTLLPESVILKAFPDEIEFIHQAECSKDKNNTDEQTIRSVVTSSARELERLNQEIEKFQKYIKSLEETRNEFWAKYGNSKKKDIQTLDDFPKAEEIRAKKNLPE